MNPVDKEECRSTSYATYHAALQDEERTKFADALKYYMAKFGRNQRNIARRMSVSEATVSQWCKGIKLPRPYRIQALADYFGISYQDMLALPATEDFADLENPGSGIVEEIDSLARKIERANRPLVYGGKELSDESVAVLEAVIELIKS